MHINELHIRNFRGIKDCKVEFSEGSNLLTGPNNSGKSTIIDALRICLSQGKFNRDIWITKTDFHVDSKNPVSVAPPIELTITYSAKDKDIPTLLSLHDAEENIYKLTFRAEIDIKKGKEKIKHEYIGGAHETIDRTYSESINCVYLDPLRDAERNLRPMKGNLIGKLFQNLVPQEDEKKKLSKAMQDATQGLDDWNGLIKKGEKSVCKNLNAFSFMDESQKVSIALPNSSFERVTEALSMQVPIYDEATLKEKKIEQQYFPLAQLGLGVNNLIYIATILGDIEEDIKNSDSDYFALLIEEPEAHLHPQLQRILHNYFSEVGLNVQLFMTTHSPTVVSNSDLTSNIFINNKNGKTVVKSLSKLTLQDPNKNYLRKFFDTTKAELLFANKVILVEGISEQLILNSLARKVNDSYDLVKNGIEVINISGVSFSHFAPLFDTQKGGLHTKCAILTDDDRSSPESEASERAQNTKKLDNGKNLQVFLAEQTLEYELFKSNEDFCKKIFQSIHSKIKVTDETVEKRAETYTAKLKSNKTKSEFALQLSVALEEDSAKFKVPDYIEKCISWIYS